jgi:hypothetical protein
MARSHVNSARLMVFVIIAAIAAACLSYPSAIMASAVYTLAWSLLLASILMALYQEEPSRYFWSGFAVFGLGHQFLTYQTGFRLEHPPLLTQYIIILGRALIVNGIPGLVETVSIWVAPAAGQVDRILVDIATSYLSIMIAYISGLVTQVLIVRRDQRRSQSGEVK